MDPLSAPGDFLVSVVFRTFDGLSLQTSSERCRIFLQHDSTTTY